MKKRVVSILLCATMAVGILAGCGSGNSESSNSDSSDSSGSDSGDTLVVWMKEDL